MRRRMSIIGWLATAGLLWVLPACGTSFGVPDVTIEDIIDQLDGQDDLADQDDQDDQVASFDAEAPPTCVDYGSPASTYQQDMLDEINLYRQQNGLNTLVYSRALETAADAHLRDMWQFDYFDHYNLAGDGPGERALNAGFCHKYVGENLAAGQTSSLAALQAWNNSPSHQRNMLEPDFVYVGMGHFVDPITGRHFWAQLFAFDLP